ncbi:MAG: XRE family transcriptional regulator [Acidobacteriota bacterium]|nr:XRE family transcriptional regulator [Acidobacteriota bacterium]
MFNGERLKQARELLGMTQHDLAVAARMDQSYVSLIEQSARQPPEATIETLALTVGFPTSFFSLPSGPDFPLGSLLFRRKSGLSSAEAAKARQLARIIFELHEKLQIRFKPLAIRLPRVGDSDPAEAAQITRSYLGYSPDGPIRGLMHRVEKAGVLIFRLPLSAVAFDALSAWSSELRPLIALGQPKSGDRDRATVAHELGHLVLHSIFLGELSTLEQQAGAFAGELLLPEADMREEAAQQLTLTRLAELKSRWGVSMQLILKRLGDLELISPQQKSYWRGKMDKQGWLEVEPVPIPSENPGLLRQMLEAAYGAPVDARRVAQEMAFPARFIAEVMKANGREPILAPRAAIPAEFEESQAVPEMIEPQAAPQKRQAGGLLSFPGARKPPHEAGRPISSICR